MEYQINHIDSVAYLCPVIGGIATFKARTLQAIYGNIQFYDEWLLCASQGLQFRKAKLDAAPLKEEVKMLLFPNPTMHELNIVFENAENHLFVIDFYDVLGNKVFSLPQGSKKNQLDLLNTPLQKGYYIVSATDSYSGKIYKSALVYEK